MAEVSRTSDKMGSGKKLGPQRARRASLLKKGRSRVYFLHFNLVDIKPGTLSSCFGQFEIGILNIASN